MLALVIIRMRRFGLVARILRYVFTFLFIFGESDCTYSVALEIEYAIANMKVQRQLCNMKLKRRARVHD